MRDGGAPDLDGPFASSHSYRLELQRPESPRPKDMIEDAECSDFVLELQQLLLDVTEHQQLAQMLQDQLS